MSYQFKAQESIPVGIKRIAREQIGQALKQLKAADNNKEEAVHESRKRLKEIRALLRLVREPLGKKTYRRENECFRDAGRQLSDVRDAQVLIKTLDKLAEHCPDSTLSDAFTTIRGELKDHYSLVYQQAIEQGNNVSVVTNTLKTARKRIDDWTIEPDDWSALSPGLKKVYKQGYKDFEQAGEQPTAENLHEWRKRVKDLWYHVRILSPIWSEMMGELADQLHDLSNYLGDDHDLAVLKEFITDRSQAKDSPGLNVLTALIERRRLQLQSEAQLLGQRIYTEKAKDFVNRIGEYWQTWQNEQERSLVSVAIDS